MKVVAVKQSGSQGEVAVVVTGALTAGAAYQVRDIIADAAQQTMEVAGDLANSKVIVIDTLGQVAIGDRLQTTGPIYSAVQRPA